MAAQHKENSSPGRIAVNIATSVLAVAGTANLASKEALGQSSAEGALSRLTLPEYVKNTRDDKGGESQVTTQSGTEATGVYFDREFNESKITQPAVTDSIRKKIVEILRSSRSPLATDDAPDADFSPAESDEILMLSDEELMTRALEIIHERVETAERLELREKLEKNIEEIEKLQEQIRLKRLEEVPLSYVAAAIAVAAGTGLLVGIGIYECIRDFYRTARAYDTRGKVVKLWDSFESSVTIDPPSTGSAAFSYPRSVAEFAGEDLLKVKGIDQRIPKKMLEVFSTFGLAPKIVVWADGMQATLGGIDFSGVSARTPGIEIKSLDAFRYLGSTLWKGFVTRSDASKSFVKSVIENAQGNVLRENSLERVRHSKWVSSVKYLAKLSSYLELDDSTKFFKDLAKAAKLPRDIFEKVVNLEKNAHDLVTTPFAVQSKVEGVLGTFEHLVERLEKRDLSKRKHAAFKDLLASTAERLESSITTLADVDSRYAAQVADFSDDDFFSTIDDGSPTTEIKDEFSIYSRATAVISSLQQRISAV
jgi:hypothetical protein